jgi:hypothetical protein
VPRPIFILLNPSRPFNRDRRTVYQIKFTCDSEVYPARPVAPGDGTGVGPEDLCSPLFALCSPLFALCSSLFALRSLLFALCSPLFALCSPRPPTPLSPVPCPLTSVFCLLPDPCFCSLCFPHLPSPESAIQYRFNHSIQVSLRHRRPGRQTKPPIKQILRHFSSNNSCLIVFSIMRLCAFA